jgi:hypothetical protein
MTSPSLVDYFSVLRAVRLRLPFIPLWSEARECSTQRKIWPTDGKLKILILLMLIPNYLASLMSTLPSSTMNQNLLC